MPFTGGLLLADGFIQQLYVHMGFHPAWEFESVVELLIESGNVVAALDRSAAMKELRDRLGAEPLRPTSWNRDEVMGWIKRAVQPGLRLERVGLKGPLNGPGRLNARRMNDESQPEGWLSHGLSSDRGREI